jgi:predicted nucleic acid-binding protein
MLHGLVGSRHASLSEQLAAYPEPPLPDGLWARAEEVGRLVTEAGHRVRLIDVLIAAWAELGGHVLVHYDQRCEEIAAVTGQPARWVAPQGTL